MFKRFLGYILSLLLVCLLVGTHALAGDYKELQPEDLKIMLNEKDFFLLDVHIPEQTHIPGTDAFIDYRKIKQNSDKLPADKNTKIVVYCRSGSMSKSAADDLLDIGYTNVYDLDGGIRAFNKLP